MNLPMLQTHLTVAKTGQNFRLESPYQPAGDQPTAITQLVEWVGQGARNSTLLGVTGSGKTYTMAQIIARTNRPALVLAHNKTLAAQLYEEFKAFFPHNAVEYFVSYYDYYQPEAYVPRSDTFIEKTAQVNEQIDRLRHSATRALLERRDVIVIASVSCIYGIGEREYYADMVIPIAVGDTLERDPLLRKLADLQYTRNDLLLERTRAVFVDEPVARYYGAPHAALTLEATAHRTRYRGAVSAQPGPLREAILAALDEVLASGEAARIYARWGLLSEPNRDVAQVV
ncbi:MAG: hypothetical protein EBR79_01405, partial [Proteobacteria bacterium]|nr:hypothetical protein [Pseudomonadota bacterium]